MPTDYSNDLAELVRTAGETHAYFATLMQTAAEEGIFDPQIAEDADELLTALDAALEPYRE